MLFYWFMILLIELFFHPFTSPPKYIPLQDFFFSRMNYQQPSLQHGPHQTFEEEVNQWLLELFHLIKHAADVSFHLIYSLSCIVLLSCVMLCSVQCNIICHCRRTTKWVMSCLLIGLRSLAWTKYLKVGHNNIVFCASHENSHEVTHCLTLSLPGVIKFNFLL